MWFSQTKITNTNTWIEETNFRLPSCLPSTISISPIPKKVSLGRVRASSESVERIQNRKYAIISRLCLNLDVFLIAKCFEHFRQTCTLDYRLDPAHYYILLGFTFDACLKCTEQELDLFTDSEKFLFIENSIHGGISVASYRHAKANNPHVPDYDHKSPTPISLIWMPITFMVKQ